MLLVSCKNYMQKNANTCYMHMQEIANTCMSKNFQLLCVLSSQGSALQQHPISPLAHIPPREAMLGITTPPENSGHIHPCGCPCGKNLKNGQSPTPLRGRNPMQCTT